MSEATDVDKGMMQLSNWIEANMPELDKLFVATAIDLNGVRKVLNEITGLDVPANANISAGGLAFLERLKHMKQLEEQGYYGEKFNG
jgi:hypothetical protein